MSGLTSSVFLVAAEPSGDQLGAALAAQFQSSHPDIKLHGIGGTAMKSAGIRSDFDVSPLAILGFTEALKAYPTILKKVQEAVQLIIQASPDVVVLIDSWGFMIRVAQGLRRASYKGEIVKYVAPQVWAMREGRAKVLAKSVDHLLTIHSFDAPYFEKHGLPVTFVGNPMFDDKFLKGGPTEFRSEKGLTNKLVGAVLFGSRPSEVERLYEPFAQTISKLITTYPKLRVFSPLSDGVAGLVQEKVKNDDRLKSVTLLPEGEKYELFKATDLALAASGTVTTQLAIMGVPTVVAYKLSPLTFFVAKRLFKPSHISLINISAGETLMPELVQGDCNADRLIAALTPYVLDDVQRKETSIALQRQAAAMKGKGGPASQRAASAILELLG